MKTSDESSHTKVSLAILPEKWSEYKIRVRFKM
jgi:hypothetical protein